MAKAKKKNGGKTKKKKTTRTLAPDAVAMKGQPASKPNAFETLWTRKKFDILGRKQKGQGRRVGHARSLALEKRKRTLLQEYNQSGKANAFLDRRFGENDDTLGDEDKAIIRFQRERQARMLKKNKYSLEDGEEDILTHHGAALSTLDDFEDEIGEDDEDGPAELDDTIRRKLNFGASSDQDKFQDTALVEEHEHKQKSKKEVMEEIIAKSKFYKAQKAKEKEETEDLMEKLDKDFTALTESEALLSLVRPHKERLKDLLSKKSSNVVKDERNSSLVEKAGSEKDLFDDYDNLVKGMTLDIRVRASDRTKTPEELAQEERDRLEKLEKERKKRMLDNEDSDDDNNDDDQNMSDSNRNRRKKMKMLSGDDLGDSFLSDDELDKKGWVDEVLERREEDSEESDSDDGTSASEETEDVEHSSDTAERLMEQNWEQSDDESEHVEKFREEIPGELGGKRLKNKQTENVEIETEIRNSHKATDKISTTQKTVGAHEIETLPFVIDAPSNLRELKSLLDNRSDDQIVEAIRRIRTCNAISLAAENRRKMQVFYGVLLQYFAVLADEKPLKLNKLNLLVRPLMEISLEIPYFAAICARKRLVRIRNEMSEKLKNPEKKSCWLSAKALLLLRLWSLIFPSSDFRHVVMTPAVLLMSECLIRCPVSSRRDIAIGAFLCSMLLSVARKARRFFPEAVKFLQALLISAVAPSIQNKMADFKLPTFMSEHSGYRPWLHLSCKVSILPPPLDFTKIMEAGDDVPLFDSNTFGVGIIYSVTETLRGFVNIYQDIASFPEVFASFVPLLHEIIKENVTPESLQTRMTGLAQLISEKIEEHEMLRQPLRMHLQKPVPIKQFNPRFEENFVHGRDYDPDRERAQKKKLEHQYKREAKGAARELRKDNYFLQEVKARERALAEEERAEKYRKAMVFLQEQEHAFKSGQLGRGRKKRK